MSSRAHPFAHYSALNVDVTPPPPSIPASLSLLAIQARTRRHINQNGGLLDVEDLINMTVGEPFVALPLEHVQENGVSKRLTENEIPTKRASPLGRRTRAQDSRRWDQDWLRCIHAVDSNGERISNKDFSTAGADGHKAFAPGSFEGSWEGIFTVSRLHRSLASVTKPPSRSIANLRHSHSFSLAVLPAL